MEKVMVIVFDDERKAHQGITAIQNLNAEGSILLHTAVFIRRDEKGISVLPNSGLEDSTHLTYGGIALGGTLLGALIGLLGGPAGAAAGAAFGAIAGFGTDMVISAADEDLVRQVSDQLQPGEFALLLELTEDWTTPVDRDLEPYAKQVFRRAKVDVDVDLREKRIEAAQKEMNALEQEWQQAREDRKAKIHARMEELRDRNRHQIEHLKQRRERLQSENKTRREEGIAPFTCRQINRSPELTTPSANRKADSWPTARVDQG